jgi:hypothetical protein
MSGGGGEGCARGAVSQVLSKWVTVETRGLDSKPLQFAVATMTGGAVSAISGGKFATGAQTAAFGYLYNELSRYPGTPRSRLALAGYEGVANEGEYGVTWKPNYPATVPVVGETADALICTAKCVGNDIYATGGREATGHSKGSHHYDNEAVDFRKVSVPDSKVLACAANCGFEAGWFESWGTPHWHFQLRPGNNVPRITPDPVTKRPSTKEP